MNQRKIVLQHLSEKELDNLRPELYKLCQQIFDHVPIKEFKYYVTDSQADKTYLRLYYNSDQELVGFFALHVFDLKEEKRKTLVFRAQAGLIQEYRRSRINMYFSLFIILRYRIAHPFSKIYCFLAILSPSMYGVIAKYLKHCTPRYDSKATDHEKKLIARLKKKFNFEKEGSTEFWISPNNWISRSSDNETSFWQNSTNPHIQFYLRNNPEYYKGSGLMTLVPFSWKNIIFSSLKVSQYILKKKFKKKAP